MTPLALDSASTTGFAFLWPRRKDGLYGGPSWEFGTVRAYDRLKRIDLLKWATEMGCTHVALEQPYLGVNAKTYGDLKELRGMWIADAAHEGLALVDIDLRPSCWQRQMLVKNGRQCPAGMTKEWSCDIASMITGVKFAKTQHDSADAVCICQYVLDAHRLGVLTGETS